MILDNQQIKKICLDLAMADSEEDVVKTLDKAGLWNDPNVWQDFDKNPNNFSTIGNQQSSPDSALVEKIINSVDAVLMRECQRRGIRPNSPQAPKSIQEALKEYFNIYEGKLSQINSSERSKLAENILLVATGEKKLPCYSIIDMGEGQTPERMPDTFLSLNKKNKQDIQFVQGKFNMGGTGALLFCSKRHNLQLIISRRDPQIAKNEKDKMKDKWGFTIVRREDPKGDLKSSSFRYLAPNDSILTFDCEFLPLLPGEYPKAYVNPLRWGTFIKLYEYQMPGLTTIVKFNLYYRLSLLLPNIALPVKIFERRKGYSDPHNTYHIILSGLAVRLDEDKSENLEPGFPSSSNMKVAGQEMKILVYAFKKGKRENYSKREGIVFTINGQSHGFIPQTFFERKPVGMSYIADSILVIVDCSKFERRIQEDLFMNSRDRLRDTEIKQAIEEQLQDLIKDHDGLRALRDKRRREEIERKLNDSRPLAETLEKLIKKSPSLSKLLIKGERISNPFDLKHVGTKSDFCGKEFPTYFRLVKEFTKDRPKNTPINNKAFRLQFETDAENEYFERDKDPGQFFIFCNDQPIQDFRLDLWNGLASLKVEIPAKVRVGDILYFKTETHDISRVEPLYNEFHIKIIEPINRPKRPPDVEKKQPPGKEKGKEREIPSQLALPNIIELTEQDANWSNHFKEKQDALSVKDDGEGSYDFFINKDNLFLKTEIKMNTKADPRLLEARFKYGMVLIGLSLIHYFEKEREKHRIDDEISVFDQICKFSKAVSPVLLPMIDSLAELDID